MFLHSFHPNPILLDLNFVQIHWYGFLIALGIILGFIVFYYLSKKADFPAKGGLASGWKKDFILNLSFWLIIWGMIGARLYHVLSEIDYYLSHPLEIFYIWQGGMGIYGAVIAGVLVIYYFTKKNKIDFLQILDFIAPSLALALAIGRWGNYFNQELYGLPTNLPWSIPIDPANRLAGYENFDSFHPTFLYESLFCLILFIFLYILAAKNKSMSKSGMSTKIYQPGYIFISYIFLYSLWRFFIEFLRLDSQPAFLNLRLGQWVSLTLTILSLVVYFVLKKWYNKTNQQKTINN